MALALAAAAADAFPDGVTIVELAAVADPALVGPTIARALGTPETAGHAEGLRAALRDQGTLLLLDISSRCSGPRRWRPNRSPAVPTCACDLRGAATSAAAPAGVLVDQGRAIEAARLAGAATAAIERLGTYGVQARDQGHYLAIIDSIRSTLGDVTVQRWPEVRREGAVRRRVVRGPLTERVSRWSKRRCAWVRPRAAGCWTAPATA